MGNCCYSREFRADIEEEELVPMEESLYFQKNSTKYIYEVLSLNAINHKITRIQLQTTFSELSIPLTKFNEFYSHLLLEINVFDFQKIMLLGILFGFGEVSVKIEMLFKCYLDENSEFLTEKNINKMMKDLVYMCCVHIPSYTLSRNLYNIELKDYTAKLRSNSNGLAEHLTKEIIGEETEIDFDGFKEAFKKKSVSSLLVSKKLREYASNTYERPPEKTDSGHKQRKSVNLAKSLTDYGEKPITTDGNINVYRQKKSKNPDYRALRTLF